MKNTILFLITLFPFFLCGQTHFSILSSKKTTNEKIEALKKIKNSYTSTNLDSALYLAELIDSLAVLTSDIKIKSESLSDLALLSAGNNLAKAYECGFKNIEMVTESKNEELIISAYLLMARLNYFNRQEEKIFEFLNKAIFIAEKSKNKEFMLLVYGKGQEFCASYFKYNESMNFLIKKSKIDTSLIHDPLYNEDLAGLYESVKKNDSAEYYYQKAMIFAENNKDTIRIVSIQVRYSVLLLKLKNIKSAIELLKKGIVLSEITNDKQSSSNAIHYLAKAYFENKDFINAKKNQIRLIEYNIERKCNICLIGEYRFLSEINVSLKNYKEAYNAIKNAYEIYVEINSAESTNNLRKVEINQINKEKQFEIDLSNREKESEKRIKNISFIALMISFIFILGIVFSLFKITKAKKIIAIQQKETENQKHLIEEKHQEITDSINYAERIQRSFLATKSQLDENLKDYFILFQPKDVVSGDFYWAHTLNNGNFALVTADSTGHGVPGAIMSLLNTSSLEKAVELGITEPAEILNHTRKTIIDRLKKDGSIEGGKDGMDCSLISIDISKTKLTYSAANNPIWIIRDNAIIELTADKIPVGKHDRDSVSFTQHEIELQKGDMIYTLTDGFPDQFGGSKGKKFMYKKLKEMLISIAHKPTNEQQTILKDTLKNWMDRSEQVDDITIIGIRV